MKWHSNHPAKGVKASIERMCATGQISIEEKEAKLEAEDEQVCLHGKYQLLWSIVGMKGQREFMSYNDMEEVKVRESVSFGSGYMEKCDSQTLAAGSSWSKRSKGN